MGGGLGAAGALTLALHPAGWAVLGAVALVAALGAGGIAHGIIGPVGQQKQQVPNNDIADKTHLPQNKDNKSVLNLKKLSVADSKIPPASTTEGLAEITTDNDEASKFGSTNVSNRLFPSNMNKTLFSLPQSQRQPPSTDSEPTVVRSSLEQESVTELQQTVLSQQPLPENQVAQLNDVKLDSTLPQPQGQPLSTAQEPTVFPSSSTQR